jgi:transposase
MKDFLPAQEVTHLKAAHRIEKDRKRADRIKTILALNVGLTYEQTAKLLLLDETTIRRYEKEYEKSGIDGLLEDHYHGSPGFLSEAQERDLEIHLRTRTCHSVKAICWYTEKAFGISYSVEGMTHLLHRLGFVYKKTKVVPEKFDPKKQAFFLSLYKAIKECKYPEDRIYFLDATHPQHNTKPSFGWIYKGDTKTIKGNSGRKRINLNGALSLEDMDITVLEEETINTQAMIRLFTELERKQKTGTLYAIVDNASYNHSKELKAYIKKHKRIEIHYLPAYSPNLNVIERLWLFFQKKMLYDRYYPTFKEFRLATHSFFANMKQYDAELRTLLTDSFQVLPA